MIGDIKQNVIVEVTAKTQQATREMDKLDKSSVQASNDMQRVAKAMDMIGLGAQNQVPKLQRLHDGFQSFTGKIGQGINAIDKFAKSLGPWNQTLELGGKVVKFADAGLDAYAKTSQQAAADVEELRGRFTGLKDAVLETTGAFVSSILKRADLIEDTKRAAADFKKTLDGVDQSVAFKMFFGGIKTGREIGSFFGDDETVRSPVAALTDAFKGFRASLHDVTDFWNADGTAFVDSMEKGFEKTKDKIQKAKEEAKRFRAEIRALSSKNAKDITDAFVEDAESGGYLSGLVDRGEAGYGAAGYGAGFGKIIDDTYAKMQAQNRGSSMLESLFGSVDEINLYKESWDALGGTFTAFTDAVGASYEAIVTGQGSVTAAFRNVFASSLMALGKSSVVEALHETALGFGKLALGPLGGPSAAMHFKSAALHGAVAVAAGVAAGALGGGGGGGGASSAASSGGGAGRSLGASVTGQGNQPGEQGRVDRLIIYGDSFADDSPRMRQIKARQLVDRATGGYGEDN